MLALELNEFSVQKDVAKRIQGKISNSGPCVRMRENAKGRVDREKDSDMGAIIINPSERDSNSSAQE